MDTAPFPYDCDAGFSPESCVSDSKNGDHFAIDDLLDFPTDDNAVAVDAGLEAAVNGNSVHSSPGATGATDSSCNSPFSVIISSPEPYFNHPAADVRCTAAGHFSGEICDPYDDLAELEWLSNVVDESFSSEDLQKLHLLQGIKTRPDDAVSPTNLYHFHPHSHSPATGSPLRPGKPACAKAARSKRSRVTTGNWPSRLLEMTPTPPGVAVNSESESDKAKKAVKPAAAHKKKDGGDGTTNGEVRKCLHCATDKTPQWRTGPLGPKTLCNACGVRFKSGRLVPEYRPAASPTFVQTQHSNSHRKVLELRRQKEMQKAQPQAAAAPPPYLHQHHHQNVMYDVASGDEYLIHQHIGRILER